jgi:hypothetical protein
VTAARAEALATLSAYTNAVLAGLADNGPGPDWAGCAHRLALALRDVLAGPELPEPARDPEPVRLAAIRALLQAFDWERDDRQYALERIERIATGELTASGFELAGGAYLTAADTRTALGALADAVEFLEHRAGQSCPDCEASPVELCGDHAADLEAAGAYRALTRVLGAGL